MKKKSSMWRHMIGDPVLHVSPEPGGVRGGVAALYHGVGCRRHGAVPQSAHHCHSRRGRCSHNNNSNTQAGVRSVSGGRTKPASEWSVARRFRALFCSQPRAGRDWARDLVGDPVGARRERGAPAARVTCPFVRQPAEHVCAWVAGCCGVEAAATACGGEIRWVWWLPLR